MEGRLYRSTRDKVFGGVCAGLAEYFKVDTALLRIITALLIVFTVVGLIVYIACVFIIPPDTKVYGADRLNMDYENEEYVNSHETSTYRTDPEKTRIMIGGGLVVAGVLFLMKSLAIFSWINMKYVIPVVLIILGVGLLVKGRREQL